MITVSEMAIEIVSSPLKMAFLTCLNHRFLYVDHIGSPRKHPPNQPRELDPSSAWRRLDSQVASGSENRCEPLNFYGVLMCFMRFLKTWDVYLVGGCEPLWKTWVRQLGWWNSIWENQRCSKPQTRHNNRFKSLVPAIANPEVLIDWRLSHVFLCILF